MSYYNILNSMRVGVKEKHTPITRSVNLMCAILDGVTYSKLYEEPFWRPGPQGTTGDPDCALEKMHHNATNLHADLRVDPAGNSYNIHKFIPKLLEDIRTELSKSAVPPVYLRDLFLRHVDTTTYPDDPYLDKINKLVEKLFLDHSDKLNHFCTPFVLIQSTNPVDPWAWANFIKDFGALTLKDLFSKKTKANLSAAVADAIRAGILKDLGKRLPLVYTDAEGKEKVEKLDIPNGGNSSKCYYNETKEEFECIASFPYHWCNLTEDGECSAMSD